MPKEGAMQFLKILFWCLLAFVAALFTYGNWHPVTIQLWGQTEALVKLPFLLLVAFLAGLLPTLAWNHAVRWRLRQRLAAAEREAAQARYAGASGPEAVMPLAPPNAATPDVAPAPMGAPGAVPPGVA
jgi:lipopolysaccharide assembly protein A